MNKYKDCELSESELELVKVRHKPYTIKSGLLTTNYDAQKKWRKIK